MARRLGRGIRREVGRHEPRLRQRRQLHPRRRRVESRGRTRCGEDADAGRCEGDRAARSRASSTSRPASPTGRRWQAASRRYFGRVIGTSRAFALMHSWRFAIGRDVHRKPSCRAARRSPCSAPPQASSSSGRRRSGRADWSSIRGRSYSRSSGVTESKVEDQAESRVRAVYSAAAGARHSPTCRPSRLPPSRPARPRALPAKCHGCCACATASASGDGSRRQACPTTSRFRTEAAKALSQGPVHLGGGLRARQPAAARSDHGGADVGHAAADQQHADGAARQHRRHLARRRRHRHHEHHARVGDRADARDRPAHGRSARAAAMCCVQFLIEAFTLSVVGGLIGVAFGFVASSVVDAAARVADEDVGRARSRWRSARRWPSACSSVSILRESVAARSD